MQKQKWCVLHVVPHQTLIISGGPTENKLPVCIETGLISFFCYFTVPHASMSPVCHDLGSIRYPAPHQLSTQLFKTSWSSLLKRSPNHAFQIPSFLLYLLLALYKAQLLISWSYLVTLKCSSCWMMEMLTFLLNFHSKGLNLLKWW